MLYFITTMTHVSGFGSENETYDRRCIGFYQAFADADNAVRGNACDIHEQAYTYCVIESIQDKGGIYPWVDEIWWYKWNDDGYYEPWDPPALVRSITNYCLG